METLVLGIDLGTTSVKVSIVDVENKEVVDHFTKPTVCDIPVNIEGAHEQSVATIISTLNICISKLSDCVLKKITKIGVCGQMHGVLLWSISAQERPWIFQEKSYRLNERKVSSLYTWQDARCDPSFLASLPKPDSHLGISTGFGIPTLFWLQRNTPEFLKKYNRAGLISSFVVAMLCDQDLAYTSYQNAASWGYFNCRDSQWNLRLLEKNDFPIEILPRLKPSGECIGTLTNSWYGIPKGTPVGVDLGDLQCSILSTIDSDKDAVINFSTSSQLAFIVNNYTPPKGPPLITPLSYWPYFDNQYVVVAASLNGGNILVMFVNMLKSWLLEVGEDLDTNKVWERLISLAMNDSMESELKINPTCLGERFDPEMLASVSKVTGANVSLGHVFKKICTGLIENLYNMLPAKLLIDAKIKRIVGNGTGLFRNPLLQLEIERMYQLPVVFEQIGDASKGAALAMDRNRVTKNNQESDTLCLTQEHNEIFGSCSS